MAIAKVIFNNGITSTVWMDVTQDTVVSSNLLSGESATRADGVSILGTYVPPSFSTMSSTFTPTETTTTITPATGYDGFSQVKINGISSTYVGTGITRRSAADLTSNGAYITAPIGYYSSAVSKAVATATQATPGITVDANGLVTATATQTAGYVTAGTKTSTYQLTVLDPYDITPTSTRQLAAASGIYTLGSVYVNAISSTYVGSGIARLSSADLTASGSVVTAPAGYYSANAAKAIAAGSVYCQDFSSTINPWLYVEDTGLVSAGFGLTAGLSASITPGYVGSNDWYEGTLNVNGFSSCQLSTRAGATITPTTASQLAVSSGYFTTGSVYVGPIPSAYIIPTGTSNITSNGIYDVTNYASASVSVVGLYQSKTVIPGTSPLTIVPDYILTAINKSQSARTFNGAIGSLYQPGSFTTLWTATSMSYIKINGDFVVGFGTSASPIGSVRATFSDIIISNLETSSWHDFVLNGSIIPHDGMTVVDTTGFMHDIYFYRTESTYTLNFDFGPGYAQYSSAFYYYKSSYIVDFCGNSDFTVYDGLSQVTVTALPDIYRIYESLAYRRSITSSGAGVSDWANSLSFIQDGQFAEQRFNGDFTFQSASYIGEKGFAFATTGGLTASANFVFPSITTISSNAFINNINIRSIDASMCSTIKIAAFSNANRLLSISFPSCTSMYSLAFCSCTNLKEAVFPYLQSIEGYCFSACINLSFASFERCLTIAAQAFNGCKSLTTVYFPSCTSILTSGFVNAEFWSDVSFPECTRLQSWAFMGAKFHGIISMPKLELMSANAFSGCSISYVSFSALSSISPGCFSGCTSLAEAHFESVTFVGGYAFSGCANLSILSLSKVNSTASYAFANCAGLLSMRLPSLPIATSNIFDRASNITMIALDICNNVNAYAFRSCYNLLSLYLLGSSIATLDNVNAFNSTPISTYTTSTGGVRGSIYVPSSLYADYSTATNWKTFSARFVSMTDAQISAFLSSLG